MAFKLIKGKVRWEWLPVTTSTALSADSAVEFTNGYLAAADADEEAVDIRGILVKAIAATDADYAVARSVAVQVPCERHTIWEATLDGVTAYVAATHRGTEVALADSTTLDLNEAGHDCFLVTGAGSSSSTVYGHIQINGSY